jgi:hypothetical protein
MQVELLFSESPKQKLKMFKYLLITLTIVVPLSLGKAQGLLQPLHHGDNEQKSLINCIFPL